MAQVITLYKGDKKVIVEPGSPAEKSFAAIGYSQTTTKKPTKKGNASAKKGA